MGADATSELYTLKNLPFFAKEEVIKQHKAGKKFSRNQLIEMDRSALVKTFEQCIGDVN
jgi:hypothetical protein